MDARILNLSAIETMEELCVARTETEECTSELEAEEHTSRREAVEAVPLVLRALQLEYPGSLTSLLQQAAALLQQAASAHIAYSAATDKPLQTQAAHRTALANMMYLQVIMGQRMLPALLACLGQTATKQPAAAQCLREKLAQKGHLGAAVLHRDRLTAQMALKDLGSVDLQALSFGTQQTEDVATVMLAVSSSPLLTSIVLFSCI